MVTSRSFEPQKILGEFQESTIGCSPLRTWCFPVCRCYYCSEPSDFFPYWVSFPSWLYLYYSQSDRRVRSISFQSLLNFSPFHTVLADQKNGISLVFWWCEQCKGMAVIKFFGSSGFQNYFTNLCLIVIKENQRLS